MTAGPDPSLRIGCASWLDPALIASGRFYPRRAMTAEERLRWYARVFDCVEVNATYYALPAPRTVAGWVERTPPGFLFHVKAYGLLTGHHPRPESLPAEARVLLPETLPLDRHGGVAVPRVPPAAREVTLELFRRALEPLAAAAKLGYVLFQLAPWVRFGDAVLRYLESLSARLSGWPVAVEFRHPSFIPRRTEEVRRFLAAHGLTLAAVDAPWQPFVPGVTTPGLALLRCHGRNVRGWRDQLAGRDPTVAEKYDYRYPPGELAELADRTRALATQARRVAVTFNNNNEDFPVQNALDLRRLLGLDTPDLAALRAAWRPSGAGRGPRRARPDVHWPVMTHEPEPAGLVPVEDRVIPPGGEWAGLVRRGNLLRLVDLEGRQAVDFLCYRAADPAERYNAADTMKVAGTIFLTAGHVLYSDRGQPLFTIVRDTVGRHDTIGGCCSAESNRLRYGVEGTTNCRDGFLRALAPFGLGTKDLVANVNFFMNVPVAPDGRMAIAEGLSRPGDLVELRAEMDVLAALSNCPQVHNPASGGRPTPIRLVILAPEGAAEPSAPDHYPVA